MITEEDEYGCLQDRLDWIQGWLDRHPPPRDPVVVFVARNPRLPTTPAFQRFKEFQVGRTAEQLLRRGVTHRDIREATRAGWVRFS